MKPHILEELRKAYPKGCRVELVRMDDPYRPDLVPGCQGTVVCVDDAGSIHVNWDIHSSLAVLYGVDECKRISTVPQKVIEQILEIRATGLTNMFDTNMVQVLANERGFYELVNYLIDHTKEYCHFILTGE